MQWYFIVIIAVVLGIIVSIFFSLPIYLALKATHPLHLSRDEVRGQWEKDRFVTEYDKSLRQEITFKMDDGYIINGDYMLYPGSKKFVICCHGYSVNREAELEYGLFFYRLGYNVVLYDQRGHGDNADYKTTMGYLEGKDLNQIIDQLFLKFGHDIHIGLHGVSMGATSALNVTKYRHDILWIIEDCGFVTFKNVLKMQVNKGHLPGAIFAPLASLACLIFFHFSFKDTSIEKMVKDIDIPMLIFHGDLDESVSIENAYYLNNNLHGLHKLVTYHSTHANCYSDHKDEYEKEIKEFLSEIEY